MEKGTSFFTGIGAASILTVTASNLQRSLILLGVLVEIGVSFFNMQVRLK